MNIQGLVPILVTFLMVTFFPNPKRKKENDA